MMVTIARYLMILIAIVLSPIYALWIFGGWICDGGLIKIYERWERKRRTL